MSRDIYDQFRAAQEALAVKAAEEARRLNEAAQRAADVEAAKKAEVIRAANEKQRLRDEKVAAQRKELEPVAQQLQEILEAIKNHDPRIQAAREKDVALTTAIIGQIDDPRLLFVLFLRWGNKFGLSPQEVHQLEHPKKGLIAKYLGEETPDKIIGEDFQQVTVTLGVDWISTVSEHGLAPRLKTEDFIGDNSLVFPTLATAIEHPMSRFESFELFNNKYSDTKHYQRRDRQGRGWDMSSVDLFGRREFENQPQDPGDSW